MVPPRFENFAYGPDYASVSPCDVISRGCMTANAPALHTYYEHYTYVSDIHMDIFSCRKHAFAVAAFEAKSYSKIYSRIL